MQRGARLHSRRRQHRNQPPQTAIQPPVADIAAPSFPLRLRWINAKRLRLEQLRGRPVLIEFWDFCRPNSIRTLPYLKAWHARYGIPQSELPQIRPRSNGPPTDQCAQDEQALAAACDCGDARPVSRSQQAGHNGTSHPDHPHPDHQAKRPRDGIYLIAVHSPGFDPGRDPQAVREATQRLEIAYPVLIDSELQVWQEYENAGWPARYLFDRDGMLFHYHYGEGAYQETERAIRALLASPHRPPAEQASSSTTIEAPPGDAATAPSANAAHAGSAADPPAPANDPLLQPLRPEDREGAQLVPQTADQEGPYNGPYAAGGVWVVIESPGTLTVTERHSAKRIRKPAPSTRTLTFAHPGAYPIVEHHRHTEGTLLLQPSEGLRCLATCFTPGLR